MRLLLASCPLRRGLAAAAPFPASTGSRQTNFSMQGSGETWAVYLLVAPTRSSFVGVTTAGDESLQAVLAEHNGEGPDGEGPPGTSLERPWKLAGSVECRSRDLAERAAWRVSRASGFRARNKALRHCIALGSDGLAQQEAMTFDPRDGFDGLTYALVEFLHPTDPSRHVQVRALVDTGATECDLKQGLIDELGLPVEKGGRTMFETAAGTTIETDMHHAVVRVMGRTASVRVSPIEEEESGSEEEGDSDDEEDREFGLLSNSDDALLGHDALAALGLLVDCRNRRLLAGPQDEDDCDADIMQ